MSCVEGNPRVCNWFFVGGGGNFQLTTPSYGERIELGYLRVLRGFQGINSRPDIFLYGSFGYENRVPYDSSSSANREQQIGLAFGAGLSWTNSIPDRGGFQFFHHNFRFATGAGLRPSFIFGPSTSDAFRLVPEVWIDLSFVTFLGLQIRYSGLGDSLTGPPSLSFLARFLCPIPL